MNFKLTVKPKEKKMTPVKKQQNKKKWNWKTILLALTIGSVIGTLAVLVMDKYRMREVVCKVIGIDQENALIAATCVIR